MTLKLTIACDEFDHIRALINGTVKPEGIELYFTTELTNPERHGRMVDVCELNAPTLCCARARRADHRHAGLPAPLFGMAMSSSIRRPASPGRRT
jgi:hypothetical protein